MAGPGFLINNMEEYRTGLVRSSQGNPNSTQKSRHNSKCRTNGSIGIHGEVVPVLTDDCLFCLFHDPSATFLTARRATERCNRFYVSAITDNNVDWAWYLSYCHNVFFVSWASLL